MRTEHRVDMLPGASSDTWDNDLAGQILTTEFFGEAGGTVAIDVTDTFSVSLTDTAELYVTQERTGLGPFSRPSLNGTSQRLYGSFAGKAGDAFAVDVTDTLSVSLTESVENFVTSAVTDTLSVQVTEAVEMFKAIAVTDTLSVSAGDVASLDAIYQEKAATDTLSVALTDVAELFQSEDKAATDTWSVTLTDAGAVEATAAQSNLHGRPVKRQTLRLRGRRLPDDDPAPALELPLPSPGPTAIPVALRATSPPVEPLSKYVRKAQDDADAVEREIAALLAKVIRAEQQEEEEILMLLSELD